MGKATISINKKAEFTEVKIAGVIDEDTDFSVYPIAGAAKLDLDLDGIKAINSCGIREWIKWLGSANDSAMEFKKCPKVIIDQVNMVQGFLPPKAKVTSFYVPYFSESSGSEKNVLFSEGKEFTQGGLNATPQIKDDEGNPMEMDIIETKYFKFLKVGK